MTQIATTVDDLTALRNRLNLSTNPSAMDFKDITYIPIDYESIVELLISRLKNRLPNRWTDFLDSNYGMEIIQAVAYEATLVVKMLNRYVNEMYLPTAKTADAIYNLVNLIGYKPKGPTPAKTAIKFYLTEPHDSLIIIPSFLSVGSYFYTTKECRIEPGQTETSTYAVAGSLVIDKFLTTGVVRDKYTLRENPVSYIEAVFVNDELFIEKDFIDSQEDRKVFTVSYSSTHQASIMFGDSIYGENPKEGLNMLVYYNVNNGSASNVNVGSITTINETITDINGKAVNIKCVNTEAATGGLDMETPADIKRNAPAYFRTQGRAVIKQDYIDILNNLGYEKVNVLDNSDDSNIGVFGVKIAALNSNDEILTDAEKSSIVKELEAKKVIATQIDMIKPSIVPVNVSVHLGISPSYVGAVVISAVRKLIADYLSIKNRTFGDMVTASDIYTLINSVEGVAYADQLSISEEKSIKTVEKALKGNTSLNIQDSGSILVAGSYISILDEDNNAAMIGMIASIDGQIYTLDRELEFDIPANSRIYPFLTLKYGVTAETKDIYVDDPGVLGDVSNSVVVFVSDASQTEHVVMYRSFTESGKQGEKFRLRSSIGANYPEGSVLYIKKKNALPVINGEIYAGATELAFKSTPKFTPGAVLTPRKNVSYDISTRVMTRSSEAYDNLPSDIQISSLKRVYASPTSPFIANVDYKIHNSKTIVWLNPSLLPVGAAYYVDIVSVVAAEETSDIKYYVKSVKGYTAEVSPSLALPLEDGDILDVESDSLNLSEIEIADTGTVTITSTQG